MSAVSFDFALIRKLSACQYGHFRPSIWCDVTATTRENSCFFTAKYEIV